MKKIICCVTVIVIGFVSAVGLCVKTLFAPKAVFSEGISQMKVVVDAGHGGIDGGVVGRVTKTKESDLNLQIAYRLKDVLEEKGFEVVLTRKTQGGLYGAPTKGFKRRDMQERRSVIEKEKPSYVISLHQNFYPSKSSRGAQVFYNGEYDEHKAFAEYIQAELNGIYEKQGVKHRNVSKGDLYMLQCTQAPSALVECGFLSNALDEELLVSSVWQEKIAGAIASGVLRFLSESAT